VIEMPDWAWGAVVKLLLLGWILARAGSRSRWAGGWGRRRSDR
jgi:hypothetical protein